MPRYHRPPIPITLALPTEPSKQKERDALPLATDAINGKAGRAGVTLILHGSRSQKVRHNHWNDLSEYGVLRHLTADQIARKVDWCIHYKWLRIEYDEHIPLLFLTERGWERVRVLWVQRILGWFDDRLASSQLEQVWPRLEQVHRHVKLMLLDEIARRRAVQYAPILPTWRPNEIRKLREAIQRTLQALDQPARTSDVTKTGYPSFPSV